MSSIEDGNGSSVEFVRFGVGCARLMMMPPSLQVASPLRTFSTEFGFVPGKSELFGRPFGGMERPEPIQYDPICRCIA